MRISDWSSDVCSSDLRVVVKTVDERLQGFSKLVGERLTDSTTKSQAALADLRERLAVIDKAQQNLTELSTQVVGLQDILANKQARGAFGEIQLRDLVEANLPPDRKSAVSGKRGTEGGNQ